MSINILVVDDEESIRSVIETTLEDDGHTVTLASTAEEAVLRCVKTAFDLIITDIRMRGMTGIDLLERAKKIRPETRVVIITSHASDNYVSRALELGAFDFIEKPFRDLYEISYLVKRVIDDINKSKAEAIEQPLIEKPVKNNTSSKASISLPKKTIKKSSIIEFKSKTTPRKAFKNQQLGLDDNEYFSRKFIDEAIRAHEKNSNLTLMLLKINSYNELTENHPEFLSKYQKILVETVLSLIEHNNPATEYKNGVYAILYPETSEIIVQIRAEKLKIQINRSERELRKKYNNISHIELTSIITSLKNDMDINTFIKTAKSKLIAC